LRYINAIILVLILAQPVQAADKWTTQDYTLEASFMVFHFIDWRQTRYIAKNPGDYNELNPILGSHPETWEVDAWFVGTALIHPIVTHLLPKKYRTIWQGITIGASAATVGWNFQMGIRMDF
jgi:hypothetical protein